MEYRPLEVTVISADGLKNVNTFGKMSVYAAAYILGYPQTKKKTVVDKKCGTAPKWNQKLQFTIDESSLHKPGLSLLIALKADKTFVDDKEIGEVSIPISELFDDGGDEKTAAAAERVVEYQVRSPSGKPKGTLKVSFKFGEKYSAQKGVEEPVTAYPAGYGQQGGSSMPHMAYQPPPPGMGYAAVPPPGMGYQQPHPGGYPPHGYGAYPPPGPAGYGYPPPGPAGYGYQHPVQQPQKKKNKMGMGMGLGLGAGLLGGMLIGDMVSDVGEMAAYNDGYDDAMDASGFDF